jgi:hypothetical protein
LRRIILRLAVLTVICAAALYAMRVWRVSAGSSAGTRVLVVSSAAALVGLLGLVASFRKKALTLGTILTTVGSAITVCAVVVEYSLGCAVVASLAPEETAVFGTLEATLSGFEAFYLEEGSLSEMSSSLVLDSGSGARSLTIGSGRPIRFEGYQICQLGFDLEDGQSPRTVRTRLGLLNQRAYRPFLSGLAVFGAGAAVSLVSFQRRTGDSDECRSRL